MFASAFWGFVCFFQWKEFRRMSRLRSEVLSDGRNRNASVGCHGSEGGRSFVRLRWRLPAELLYGLVFGLLRMPRLWLLPLLAVVVGHLWLYPLV